MILEGGKLNFMGGNPPFPRVLYETLHMYSSDEYQHDSAFIYTYCSG